MLTGVESHESGLRPDPGPTHVRQTPCVQRRAPKPGREPARARKNVSLRDACIVLVRNQENPKKFRLLRSPGRSAHTLGLVVRAAGGGAAAGLGLGLGLGSGLGALKHSSTHGEALQNTPRCPASQPSSPAFLRAPGARAGPSWSLSPSRHRSHGQRCCVLACCCYGRGASLQDGRVRRAAGDSWPAT